MFMTNMGYFSNLQSTHIITLSYCPKYFAEPQSSWWQGPHSSLLNYPRKLGTCLFMVSLLMLSLYIPWTVVHYSLGSSLHAAVVLLGRKVNLHPSTPTPKWWALPIFFQVLVQIQLQCQVRQVQYLFILSTQLELKRWWVKNDILC